jgi:hypothetical protein
MEMRHPGGDPHTRRRRFLSLSRFKETPQRLVLELDLAATDYFPVEHDPTDDFSARWKILRMVLEDAPQKLTRRDILLEWPYDFDTPDSTTLHRWIQLAIANQDLLQEGTGRKNDPFRYWLPDAEARWRETKPFYDEFERLRIQQNIPYSPLHPREHDKQSSRFDDSADHFDDHDEG